jgi:hypothetical protein
VQATSQSPSELSATAPLAHDLTPTMLHAPADVQSGSASFTVRAADLDE